MIKKWILQGFYYQSVTHVSSSMETSGTTSYRAFVHISSYNSPSKIQPPRSLTWLNQQQDCLQSSSSGCIMKRGVSTYSLKHKEVVKKFRSGLPSTPSWWMVPGYRLRILLSLSQSPDFAAEQALFAKSNSSTDCCVEERFRQQGQPSGCIRGIGDTIWRNLFSNTYNITNFVHSKSELEEDSNHIHYGVSFSNKKAKNNTLPKLPTASSRQNRASSTSGKNSQSKRKL